MFNKWINVSNTAHRTFLFDPAGPVLRSWSLVSQGPSFPPFSFNRRSDLTKSTCRCMRAQAPLLFRSGRFNPQGEPPSNPYTHDMRMLYLHVVSVHPPSVVGRRRPAQQVPTWPAGQPGRGGLESWPSPRPIADEPRAASRRGGAQFCLLSFLCALARRAHGGRAICPRHGPGPRSGPRQSLLAITQKLSRARYPMYGPGPALDADWRTFCPRFLGAHL